MSKNKLIVALILGAVAVTAYMAGGRVTLDVQYPAPVSPASGAASAPSEPSAPASEDNRIESSKADLGVPALAPGSLVIEAELDAGE